MSKTNLYGILGVSSSSSTEDITSAFRSLAKVYHPDKPTGNAEKFKEISEAYEILHDREKREIYDERGLSGVKLAEQSHSHRNFTQSNGVSGQTLKVPVNNAMFNNLFSHFFGEKATGHAVTKESEPEPEPETNPPIIKKISITLKDVYCGCQKTVKYDRYLICPQCYGKGYKPHVQPSQCKNCNGDGRLPTPSSGNGFLVNLTIDCSICNGIGSIYNKRDFCDHCSGSKIIKTENTIDLTIKPGMTDKVKLKYENLGNEEPGKTPGDLIIELLIDNQTDYIIDGYNLKINLNISLLEALTIVERDILFVDGSVIRILTSNGL